MCDPAQSQCLHELHALMYRGVLVEQGRYIRDLERRLTGEPVTQVWLDGVLQPQTLRTAQPISRFVAPSDPTYNKSAL